MATLTPRLGLKKPVPNVETDWAFRLNETLDILDDSVQASGIVGAGITNVTSAGPIITISSVPQAITGSDGVTVTSGTSTIDLEGFREEFVSASGSLQTQIDDVDVGGGGSVSNALVGADGITVTSGVSIDTLTGFRTEFVNASGTLSAEIDSDISTHTAISSAHHAKYTNAEAISALEPTTSALAASGVATDANTVSVSGHLSTEIDTDITTHAAVTDAHHTKYTDSEAIIALGPTTSALAASGVATDANIVSVSGHLQTNIDNVDLQEAYDNGDGIITTADGKLFQVTGSGLVTGELQTEGGLIAPIGSAANPGLSFFGDRDTGFFLLADNVFGISAGGASSLFVSTTAFSVVQPLRAILGSQTGPHFSFLSDTDTGMYRAGTNDLGFATDGEEALRINSAQIVDVPVGLTVSGEPVSTGTSQPVLQDVYDKGDGNIVTAAGKPFKIAGTTEVVFDGLPTASAGLTSGQLWLDVSADYTLKVTPGA